MTKNIFGILMFVAGVAVGSAVTVKLVKTKYEKRANEEIESVREYYASKRSKTPEVTVKDSTITTKYVDEIKELDRIKELDGEEKIKAYSDMVKDYGYTPKETEDSENDENTKKKEIVKAEHKQNVVLITPEELGENVDDLDRCFDIVTLVYYADGVMVYHMDEHLVDDIEDLVGSEFKDHFGDYEDDAVFVRNFRNETDYEIIRDEDRYYDIWPKERGEEDG
jgi:hypothetical protein